MGDCLHRGKQCGLMGTPAEEVKYYPIKTAVIPEVQPEIPPR